MLHDVTLEGFGVRLVPQTVEHAPALAAMIDDELWRGMTTPTPTGPADVEALVAASDATPGRLSFAVLDAATGEVRGSTSYYDWDPTLRRVEIGHTYYGRRWWGTTNNPACKYLLLTHAFETWGCARVALRADARNTRSIAAITRLGARPEGVLRSHRVAPDGSRGDTAYFSVLDDEWPTVRAGLEQRLAGRAAPDERTHLLLIGGRSGVGKSTVAFALHDLLVAADVPHAVVEGDALDLAHPAAPVAAANLAAIWSRYRALGHRRVVVTNTVSVLEADALARALGDGPQVTTVLLTASDETARERLARREHGRSLDVHVHRSDAAARHLDAAAGSGTHRVATDGRSPSQVAQQVARLVGWLP